MYTQLSSRTLSLKSWGVPSSASPGALQVHVLMSVGALGRRGELDNQPERLDHGLNPLESSDDLDYACFPSLLCIDFMQ